MWVYIWLGVLALSLIVEFISMELVSIWVSVGSLVAMILAFCNVSITIQLIVFGVVTIACILGLRRIALKFFFRNKGKTNLDAIIGTTYKLIKKVNAEELGAIKVNGVEWSVKSLDNEEIDAGNFVEIVSVDGNKFIVKKVTNSSKKVENIETTKIDEENTVDSVENKPKTRNTEKKTKPKTEKKPANSSKE